MDTGMDFTSKVPQRTYATTLDEQLEQLKTDELMLRFAESRKQLSSDPYRPAYHYVNPEGNLNDPNGLCYWQGRYHLFYQAHPPEDPRQHWGHAISDDLVHWKDLPLAIYPGIEDSCFSGSTLVEEDRVIAMYHGTRAGNMVAVSEDSLLLNWEKIPGNPVIPLMEADEKGRPYRVYDPCIWKEKDDYYTLSGSYWEGLIFDDCRMVQHLFSSQDLKRWTFLGPFVEDDIFTAPGEDGAVPYFWPIGDKYILLFASHQRGSQYLLGDYDKVHHRFKPFAHARFNFGPIGNGGVHAPSATPNGRGGVYVIHNINNGKPTQGWNHIMSLVRLLTLRGDKTLGIEPVPAVEALRSDHQHVGETFLPANREIVLEGIEGNTMELAIEIDPKDAREICINVLRSPDSEEYTAIKFYRHGHMAVNNDGRRYQQDALGIDPSRSSLLPDVFARPPEVAPLELGDDEPLKLRIFIDKSVVEVFANGRQCVALRIYPGRQDSVGVSIRAQGRDAELRSLEAWQMKSIWTQA
ncbi:MAG: glycoside hydrolase family 32 protein [Lentisphaeria bacterium]|jgi:beta-fructofuranosidase|nr:glycoside hydrolase family 32 protein [Lentisphaeria bacterium]